MALGGGTFLTQNKVLPGSYINFVSAARASATISDRGVAAIPVELDWGVDGEVFAVESADLQTDSLSYFGYDYTAAELKNLREIFKHAKTVYCYRVNSGAAASNTYATAKYTGKRGNDIKIVIQANVDDTAAFDVTTILGEVEVDEQTVKSAAELIDNNYVIFKKDAELAATAGDALLGGSNKAEVSGSDYQAFLDKLESFSFNTLGCPVEKAEVIDLFIAYTKRMRDDCGVKFQTVVYKKAADYEGVINVDNKVLDEGVSPASLVYWVTGASAGCDVNKSNTNVTYDGEYNVDTNYKQSQLEAGIEEGKFLFHKVGDEVRVLTDINSFTSFTIDKNEDFSYNQVIRVLDQVANDIAVLFNKTYLGKVQNNTAGRLAFWNDIVTYNKELELLQAIEDFKSEDVVVSQGKDKKSVTVVNPIKPTVAMEKLYMTVIVE